LDEVLRAVEEPPGARAEVANLACCPAGALEFPVMKAPPKADPEVLFVSIDDFLKYTPFFADYGPPNLGKVS